MSEIRGNRKLLCLLGYLSICWAAYFFILGREKNIGFYFGILAPLFFILEVLRFRKTSYSYDKKRIVERTYRGEIEIYWSDIKEIFVDGFLGSMSIVSSEGKEIIFYPILIKNARNALMELADLLPKNLKGREKIEQILLDRKKWRWQMAIVVILILISFFMLEVKKSIVIYAALTAMFFLLMM